MKGYLLIDFGSTYTKLTAVDIENEVILGTAKAITTVEDDIMIGFNRAYTELQSKLKDKKVDFVKKLACSSAAGGLKMVAIGLVPELTAEAAKRAALGAGARVMHVYSYDLSSKEMEEIKNSKPDMILLAGGTDGGNKECIIGNAKLLAKSGMDIPIVVAGNKVAEDEISKILEDAGMFYKVAENVMPKLNTLNVEPAREEIRKIFMEKIVEAKGMKNAEKYINGIFMPTPAAVLKAARTLSLGSDKEEGIGDLVVVDIGGATTDVHSLADGEPTKPAVTLRGLQEPFAKRTVEGDLGMRYSAVSLWEAASTKRVLKYLDDKSIDIEAGCKYRSENIKMIPDNERDIKFDEAMAKVATEMAMERHVGVLTSVYTPCGVVYSQIGKDLLNTKYLIGTGGVLVHSENPEEILKAGIFTTEDPMHLKPKNPEYLIDRSYILSAMGLLSEEYPDIAVRIMKKYLVNTKKICCITK
ncbi:methylaspartate mutase accessory protein GlmL [Clostridium ljungdahlii]|uniref:MutL protein n=1 Tax=Clostridium ljungdahlii TaxID=1538 RepID=A0A166SIG8_9CLOT|nr:methylaspartate mutase accessory protein GlmL [Clostridium ljungdahlii]OAA92353.1 hypothetical protein WY13_00062 [Clostridium ljungdahlii]